MSNLNPPIDPIGPEAPEAHVTRAGDEPASADWAQAPERSNRATLRLMAWIAVHGGRRLARLVLHPITLYFLWFAPKVARNSRRFLDRALGRPATWMDRYRHIHTFAATILDRVYLLRDGGQSAGLRLEASGADAVSDAARNDPGVFMLGGHIGSFEALRAVGDHTGGLRVAMVMYPGNAQMVNDTLSAVAPQARQHIIELGQMTAMLEVRDWLDQGGLAGMLGDRALHDDHQGAHVLRLPFLGREVAFIDGPLRLAALLRRRVFFMVGLYRGGARYDVRFTELVDFRHLKPGEREARIREAVEAYVRQLEGLAREAPYNWFNFHDFWHEDAS